MTKTDRKGSAKLKVVSDTAYEVVRLFDAQADLVYRAHTEPELVKRWWGFPDWNWQDCSIDARVGGKWRFSVEKDGMDVSFHGRFTELQRPTRIAQTEIYEGIPGVTQETEEGGTLNTAVLSEEGGVTTLHVHIECYSPEVMKAIFDSGMEGGMQVSYDRMEDLVTRLAA